MARTIEQQREYQRRWIENKRRLQREKVRIERIIASKLGQEILEFFLDQYCEQVDPEGTTEEMYADSVKRTILQIKYLLDNNRIVDVITPTLV